MDLEKYYSYLCIPQSQFIFIHFASFHILSSRNSTVTTGEKITQADSPSVSFSISQGYLTVHIFVSLGGSFLNDVI